MEQHYSNRSQIKTLIHKALQKCSFRLQMHVKIATRKGKSLTDHIYSNIPKRLVHTNGRFR